MDKNHKCRMPNAEARSSFEIRRSTLLALGLLTLLRPAPVKAEETTIYVSPGGNDAWAGNLPQANVHKTNGPVATLEKAKDLVRAAKARRGDKPGLIRVELRGGTYFLNQALVLGPEDSGTQKAPIVWSTYGGERPTLSGGWRVTGWTKTVVNGREAWVAKIPQIGSPALFHELWLEGKRLSRARWPKHGTLKVAALTEKPKPADWKHGTNQFGYAHEDLKAWPTASDGEAIVNNRWTESHLPIASVDEKQHVIHFTKRSVFLLDPQDPYWIENVRECLTEPGEFYVDRAARRGLPDRTGGSGSEPGPGYRSAAGADPSPGRRSGRRQVCRAFELPRH